MKTTTYLSLALSTTSALASTLKPRAVSTVSVKGNAFFAGGQRFYIRGVDYQPGGSSDLADPIADAAGCKRDISHFKSLGINAIRVYSVDNTANHDECMNALADAGIYLILDVNTPNYSINRADPHPSYNDVYLQNVFATIDIFQKYDNTLAFFSANEVINDAPTSAAAPYVKAVTRDIRQYIRNRQYRSIPVGYSAADISDNRLQMALYMNCGTDDERSDFFAFNDYSWCDPSTFQQSGWKQKVQTFSGYGIPIFLSEFGCNLATRQFNEIASLYSTDMSAVYSGGLVYEYTMEENKYGLVQINGNTVQELADFNTLKQKYAATPNPTGDGGYNSTGGASACPAYSSPNWLVKDDSLPAMPAGAMKYMTNGAGTGQGFVGLGSQNSGEASTGTATPGSGQPTTTGSSGVSASHSSGAAVSSLRPAEFSTAPFMCLAVVVLSSIFGATLL